MLSFLLQSANICRPCAVDFRRGQAADFHFIQEFAQLRRQVGRTSVDGSRTATSRSERAMARPSLQLTNRLRRFSAIWRLASNDPSLEPRVSDDHRSDRACRCSRPRALSPSLRARSALAISVSPTCRVDWNLPRINCPQVSSARMRALTAAGEIPHRSSTCANCCGVMCWRVAMLSKAASTSASVTTAS